MKNNSFFNNLAADINKLENNNKNKIVKINFENLDYIDDKFSEDEDINYFLREKTSQIYQLQANASLELGKILTEAFNQLSGNNHYNGLYEKWLLKIGFNKMTALRHRKRYELYNEVQNEHSKKLVAVMPVRVLIDLINNNKKNEIIKTIESNENFKIIDIKNLLEQKEPKSLNEEIYEDTVFFKELYSLKKLDLKKLNLIKARELKNELEKILEEVKKLFENI